MILKLIPEFPKKEIIFSSKGAKDKDFYIKGNNDAMISCQKGIFHCLVQISRI